MLKHLGKAAAATLLLSGIVVTACSDSTSPNGQSASLSFAGVKAPGASGIQSVQGTQGDTLVVVSGVNTLRITSVQVVMRKMELERVEGSTVDCDTVADDGKHCEEFKAGTQLVSLPLKLGVLTAITVAVDSGHYSGVDFKIHTPGSDADDAAFKLANPAFANISIRVLGTYNGVAFTYTSTLEAKQKYTFATPLVIAAGGNLNLTVRIDLSTWFADAVTGALIDPATANIGGVNENVVKTNIKNSIKAYKDDDKDGNEANG